MFWHSKHIGTFRNGVFRAGMDLSVCACKQDLRDETIGWWERLML